LEPPTHNVRKIALSDKRKEKLVTSRNKGKTLGRSKKQNWHEASLEPNAEFSDAGSEEDNWSDKPDKDSKDSEVVQPLVLQDCGISSGGSSLRASQLCSDHMLWVTAFFHITSEWLCVINMCISKDSQNTIIGSESWSHNSPGLDEFNTHNSSASNVGHSSEAQNYNTHTSDTHASIHSKNVLELQGFYTAKVMWLKTRIPPTLLK
jgi:hypothetical protein